MEEIKLATDRFNEAVEKSFLSLDYLLLACSHKFRARKEELLIELFGYRRQKYIVVGNIFPS